MAYYNNIMYLYYYGKDNNADNHNHYMALLYCTTLLFWVTLQSYVINNACKALYI